MAVESFAVLELDEHGVALGGVEQAEGQLYVCARGNKRSQSSGSLRIEEGEDTNHLAPFNCKLCQASEDMFDVFVAFGWIEQDIGGGSSMMVEVAFPR